MLRLDGSDALDGVPRRDPLHRLEEPLSGKGRAIQFARRDRRHRGAGLGEAANDADDLALD
ncbi:MAG: hypothetical protein ABIO99_05570, partial [Candidatus Limnocylindria bacterium]